jgi:hypothetical protein
MKLKTAKKIEKVLNKINNLVDLEKEKIKIKKIIKKESKKPNEIKVEWVGCFELMKDGTKTTIYNNSIEFIEKELNQEPKNNKEALIILNNYCELNGLSKYNEKEIQKNLIEDIVNHYWENNRETMSFKVNDF